MPLDTLANVKLANGIATDDDDTLLTQLQATADGFVETYCGRQFEGGTFTEFHSGATGLAFLRNYPVASVTTVHVDVNREYDTDTLLDPSRYVVHAERGVIECLDGTFVPSLPGWNPGGNAFPRAVRVVYVTAVDNVPGPVARAYAELIGHWYRQIKTRVATDQKNLIQDGEVIYPWGQSGGYPIPSAIRQTLGMFKLPGL